jgi:hypothetical protein
VADLNRDGNQDVVGGTWTSSGGDRLRVLLGDGAGRPFDPRAREFAVVARRQSS